MPPVTGVHARLTPDTSIHVDDRKSSYRHDGVLERERYQDAGNTEEVLNVGEVRWKMGKAYKYSDRMTIAWM